jgi:uncharacterized delta-60 repeat protein
MRSLVSATEAAAFPFVSVVSRTAGKTFAAFSFLLLAGAALVRGQSPLDGFDPKPNDQVRVVVVQPDGKILMGGDFTTLSPNGGPTVTRNRIARLNADGTLDTAFNPNVNGVGLVLSIAPQADGRILVGGHFASIGGQPRNHIARLDATTGLADSFDPNANNEVGAIVVQADGKILVGGQFTSIGGELRGRIARLDPITGLADSFDPNADSIVSAIAVQADGRILAGGFFSNIGGQPRGRIARLDGTTGLADSFDPDASSIVYAIALQPDGKIIVGGSFNIIGGQTRQAIARLDPATGSADSLNPTATGGFVSTIAVQPDGRILAGGTFGDIGGQARSFVARLNPITGQADSFNPGPSSPINSIALQLDGKVLLGGQFFQFAPPGGPVTDRKCIARVEADGRLDRTLNLNMVGTVGQTGNIFATAVQPDGKVLIGGSFTTVLGVARTNVARLNTDGSLDTNFNPNVTGSFFPFVRAIAVQADGKILIGGKFTNIGAQTRNYIGRVDATTGLADSFNPNANLDVDTIVVQPDGKVLAGGGFAFIGGQGRVGFARLDATTGMADSLDAQANSSTLSIALQTDGKILIGGVFTTLGGQPHTHLARIDPISGFADSFNPQVDEDVTAILVQPDGKILVGGWFLNIGGQARNHIGRVDGVTGLADAFDPDVNNIVDSIALQADGKVLLGGQFGNIGGAPRFHIGRVDGVIGLVDSFNPNPNNYLFSITVPPSGKILLGGSFTSIGGQRRGFFARISNDAAALQDLAVTPTTVTWMLGGASPQLARVTFESSNDLLSYAPLGAGTAAGNTWTLTGLSLPTGQNVYIRARGYYRSGNQTGSESITESVRNAFFAGATPTPTPTVPPSPTPTASPSPTPGFTPLPATPTATPNPMPAAQAINISTRMRVQTGGDVGIGGFIITGTAPKHVLLRAIGPSLAQVGVPNVLADPVMELHGPTGFVTITNDNWRDDPVQEALIIASGIPPPNDLESAIDATLLPGAYTAIVSGKNNTSGVALVEAYDLNQGVDSKLANISTRAFVDTGDNIVIAGFILGNGGGADRIVLRGIGPSLTSGVIALPDPTLQLRDSNGALLIFNNDWQDDPAQAAELIAAGLAPSSDLESAIAATLPPGLYTALLAGRNNGTGVGLVEVYDRGNGSGGSTPTPTPSPTATVAPTPTVTPTPSVTPSGTPTPTPSPACFVSEVFEDITTLPGTGWVQINHSTGVGTTAWFQGNSAVFPAQTGSATSYIAANFDNNTNANHADRRATAPLPPQPDTPPSPTPPPPPPPSTISNWLLTPPVTLQNGAFLNFVTRTVDVPQFPDRLQVRMSTNGTSTNVGTTASDVGDFTVLMLDINPTLTTTGYPNVWSYYTVMVSGLASPTTGRLAFRYFVPDGGPHGPNGDYIGVDQVSFFCTTPPPTPTPPPPPTPTPNPGT